MSMKMRRILGGLVGAGALALAGAGPASASITAVTPTVGGGFAVVGTAPSTSGIAFYTLAVCNTTVTLGTACNGTTGTYTAPASVTSGSGFSTTITTRSASTFSNFDFTTQSPGSGTTTCLAASGGVQCAVVASYYSSSFTPLASDVFNVSL